MTELSSLLADNAVRLRRRAKDLEARPMCSIELREEADILSSMSSKAFGLENNVERIRETDTGLRLKLDFANSRTHELAGIIRNQADEISRFQIHTEELEKQVALLPPSQQVWDRLRHLEKLVGQRDDELRTLRGAVRDRDQALEARNVAIRGQGKLIEELERTADDLRVQISELPAHVLHVEGVTLKPGERATFINEGDGTVRAEHGSDDCPMVRFVLPPRYHQSPGASPNGMDKDTCIGILCDSMGLGRDQVKQALRNYSPAVSVLCTRAQFADFILLRHKRGKCINGIRDLNPKYVHAGERIYETDLVAA